MKVKDILDTSFNTILDILNICEANTTTWIKSTFKDKQLTEVGAKLTFYYFAFIIILFGWKLPSLFFSGLNEIGDFLAGVFGPVAFCWLIIGYLMQNKELKTQIEEFKNSVSVAKSNLDLDIKTRLREEIITHNKAQPLFEITYKNGPISDYFQFGISNHNAKVSDVRIYSTDNESLAKDLDPIKTFTQIGSSEIRFSLSSFYIITQDFPIFNAGKFQKTHLNSFLITYYDNNEIKQTNKLTLIASHKKNESWNYVFYAESNRRDVFEEIKALEKAANAN